MEEDNVGVERRRVLTKALVASAAALGISCIELARILGLTVATITEIQAGAYLLFPGKKEWEQAVLLVRLFRSLDCLVGGSGDDGRKWLNSENSALSGRPIDLLESPSGLVRVISYLDACRGGAEK